MTEKDHLDELLNNARERDEFSDVVVERFARAWASIDGKSEAFDRERGAAMDYDDPDYTGHFEGYMEDARELLRRANCYVATSAPRKP